MSESTLQARVFRKLFTTIADGREQQIHLAEGILQEVEVWLQQMLESLQARGNVVQVCESAF